MPHNPSLADELFSFNESVGMGVLVAVGVRDGSAEIVGVKAGGVRVVDVISGVGVAVEPPSVSVAVESGTVVVNAGEAVNSGVGDSPGSGVGESVDVGVKVTGTVLVGESIPVIVMETSSIKIA